ncbi:T9SS type A sorting domain-containing protein [Psychroserpens sp. AS72]|uniref:T9SS type A sorting domain-containing protein n=1 Tax=Psychroserpens sp. AS72 TaxID=3135775 RepID=UPI003178B497
MKKIYILLILISSFCSAQNINFTIDTAVDNGTSITETIVVGLDTYILTVFHSGNEELDDIGGGDLIFYLSAIDPLTPHMLSITKNGTPTNFNLNSIDYDTLAAGTISLTNQDGDFISNPTAYSLGAGTLTITNPANGLDISQININPTDNDDLNDFGFHNINVDFAVACNDPDIPTITSSSICSGDNPVLNITGDLNDATNWYVYSGSCGGTLVAVTTSSSVTLPAITATTTYFVRGEGGCSTGGPCGTVTVTVNTNDDASFSYDAASYNADDADPTPTITGLAGGSFSSDAGLVINASTGTINLLTSTLGTYTVTYTTAGTCPNSSSVSVTINASAVVNDECTGAIAVACGDTVTGSTVNATNSGYDSSPDVFYSFTDTILQDVTLTTCGNTDFDTIIRVFDDCPQTNQIAFNDQFCGNQSQVTFTAQPNITYYIMIDGFFNFVGGIGLGDYQLDVNCMPNTPAPGNDLCSNATALSLGVTLSGETTVGATDDSTSDFDDTPCDSYNFHSDVWYTFQAPISGQATITTVISGNSDQANVAVYSSTDCSQFDFDSVGCSHSNGGEVLTITTLIPNAIYSVRVWSDGVFATPPPETGRVEGTFSITVTDATLSTSEIDNFQAFNYYPNPVKNELVLEAQHTIDNVRVFNLLGQLVIAETPNVASKNINMAQLQTGAYFVEVTIGNTTKTIRIIKE